MSTPISRRAGLASAALLCACGQAPASDEAGDASPPGRSPVEAIKSWIDGVADNRPRIYCAIGEGASLAQDCRLETVEDAQSRVLILSRPDGGFRRLRVGAEGVLSAADGALEARTARKGEVIGVLFGDERYAVPVSALGHGATP